MSTRIKLSLRSALSRFIGTAGRLMSDRRAVSAVEFALLLPLMLTLYIGGTEVGQAVAVYRKVGHTASVLGDLVAQVSAISTSDMSNIFDAATAVMSPYAATGASMVVSAVNYDGTNLKVAWSATRNGTAWTVNATPPDTIPTTILSAGQQIVVAKVQYTYTSAFSTIMRDIWGSPSVAMSDVAYLRPRVSTTITYP